MSLTLIATTTVGAGGASSMTFASIPATYTDLMVLISARTSSTIDSIGIKFNASTTGASMRRLIGNGSSTFSDAPAQPYIYGGDYPGSAQTANTFGNFQIYIPNYAGSTNKSVSVDAVSENNATSNVLGISAGLWSSTAAITDLTFFRIDGASASFVQYTTASLYGIQKGSGGASVSP